MNNFLLLFLILFSLFLCGCPTFFAPDITESTEDSGDTVATITEIPIDSLSDLAPASISLDKVENGTLTIRGGGGTENGRLFFSVNDQNGRRVRSSLLVQFVKQSQDSVAVLQTPFDTAREGRVVCCLSSGSRSGICAVTANCLDVSLQPLAVSKAVRILVMGGLPVQENFTLQPERINLPFRMGASLPVIAFLFDKAHNPASPVMVYFSCNGGGITSGGLSDSLGMVEALYRVTEAVSADRRVTLVAETRGDSGNGLYAEAEMVLTGEPRISFDHPQVPSDTFLLARGGGTPLVLQVADDLGRPLCRGSRITLVLTGGGTLLGETEIILPDVLTGYTDFPVRVQDDSSGPRFIYLQAEVQSDNGSRIAGIWGKVE